MKARSRGFIPFSLALLVTHSEYVLGVHWAEDADVTAEMLRSET
jgi:hypothetical protein